VTYKPHHQPVLLKETLELLAPKEGETVLDLTLGLGGHALQICKHIGKEGKYIGLDADEANIAIAKENLKDHADILQVIHSNMAELPNVFTDTVDIVFADLGLSSPHIDDPTRGFMFREDAPLDCRYDRSQGITAAELIEDHTANGLAGVLFHYGELRQSHKLAKAIKEAAPQTTRQLFTAIESVVGYRVKSIAPQVFQALRIKLNRELESLEVLLTSLESIVNPGGRCGVMSYHSLEDRLVKQAFRQLSAPEIDETTGQITKHSPWKVVTKKPIMPTQAEIDLNPRSRSAKLRVIKHI
jgi:16S rRNA (cytosine1402-N4)-methyltransferase